jgi:hypothetical protein
MSMTTSDATQILAAYSPIEAARLHEQAKRAAASDPELWQHVREEIAESLFEHGEDAAAEELLS